MSSFVRPTKCFKYLVYERGSVKAKPVVRISRSLCFNVNYFLAELVMSGLANFLICPGLICILETFVEWLFALWLFPFCKIYIKKTCNLRIQEVVQSSSMKCFCFLINLSVKMLSRFIVSPVALHFTTLRIRCLSNVLKAVTYFSKMLHRKAVLQRCSFEIVFWKYAVILQENTHAEVWLK